MLSERETVVELPFAADSCPCVVEAMNHVTIVPALPVPTLSTRITVRHTCSGYSSKLPPSSAVHGTSGSTR
jgi:hypothetical protein